MEQNIQFRLDHLTKPQGSLGLLEEYILKLGRIQMTDKPQVDKKRIIVFAGDHGITEEGVSAFPSAVTQQMVLNFANGGAAINVLARNYSIDVTVVDVGVNGDFDKALPILHLKVAKGTKNFLKEDAMSEEQLNAALKVGKELVIKAKSDGIQLLGIGEMGIGNTTSASAITAALLQKPVEEITGRGTGINDSQLKHKIEVIQQALKNRDIDSAKPQDLLRRIGGFEIAAIVGVALGCVEQRLPLVIDGFIATAAIAIAATIDTQVRDVVFASHKSQEKGHRYLLEYLQLKAFLELEMRLGEGSGAAIAMDILDTATTLYNQMATFESAHVSKKA